MPRAHAPLTRAVRPALEAVVVPGKAEGMAAYMKHKGRYLGVPKPQRAAVQRALFREHALTDAAVLTATVEKIWAQARYREERYLALDLLNLPRHKKLLGLHALPLLERLVVEGAWWDLVDACSGPLGVLLVQDRAAMTKTMRAWARDSDLWKRRSAIICQLKLKEATDAKLLYAAIESALTAPGLISDLPEREQRFFLSKAAGWGLRQYARIEPLAVRDYVVEHKDALPRLTQSEALKHL